MIHPAIRFITTYNINFRFASILLSACLLFIVHTSTANNIAVSSVSLTGQNTTAGTNNAANFSLVQFNLSWENSWRVSTGPSNWDAAWVFVKFRVGASNPTFIGVSSSGTTVTVSSTTNLRVGMPVRVTSGTGAFAANSVISSITNATQFVVSATPTTPLSSASIECIRIWEHASLNTTGHTAASGSTIDVPTDGTGAFIYRSSAGSGTNTFNNTQLRWNYGANTVRDDAIVSIQVFAIEMVYVPQGSFFVGSGGTESGSFTNGSWVSGATIPFQITSEAALGIDNVAGKLWGTSSSGNNSIGNAAADAEATLAAAYPKGFAAFYCMKYEISQGQYRDFLNTLTRTQQANRVTMDGTVGRYAGGFTYNGTTWSGSEVSNLTSPANRIGLRLIADPGGISPRTYACDLNTSATLPTGVNQSDDGEWIAMGQLNWMDGCAYMQWSGLRPMTELEYEKACRGNQTAVSGEYAWGSSAIHATTYASLANPGAANELPNAPSTGTNGNASYSTTDGVIDGPLRVGAFAGVATTRAQAGATYYGIMEMSGNLWERAVTIGNTDGRAFTGLHGSGLLSTAGHATTTAWPGLTSGEVTGATGSGLRGGAWFQAATTMRVSDRNFVVITLTNRASERGFRGVRLAP
ncbi:MAG: SUMF1/EgtB/PvdO family nonheme iron enzyme [Bacteroidota bacterium]|jgi:formylglycine-generating enzyme required for sulfatase activity